MGNFLSVCLPSAENGAYPFPADEGEAALVLIKILDLLVDFLPLLPFNHGC